MQTNQSEYIDAEAIVEAVQRPTQDAAGLKRFTPRGLRHLFESEPLKARSSPVQVREQMGHTSIEMTNRYAHAVRDVKAHTEAVARVFTFPVSNLLAEQMP